MDSIERRSSASRSASYGRPAAARPAFTSAREQNQPPQGSSTPLARLSQATRRSRSAALRRESRSSAQTRRP